MARGRGACVLVRLGWALLLVSALGACERRDARRAALVRQAGPRRDDLEQYARWVERTLRTHQGDSARPEVLFSPLRLESDVLDAVVEVGDPARPYRLRGSSEPAQTSGWVRLSTKVGAMGPVEARRGLCKARGNEDETVDCLWLRLDARDTDPVVGFRVRVAYRAPH